MVDEVIFTNVNLQQIEWERKHQLLHPSTEPPLAWFKRVLDKG